MKKENAAIRIIGLVIRMALIAIALFLVIRISRTAYDYGYETFAQKPITEGNGRIVTITVTESDTVSDIAKLLEEKGIGTIAIDSCTLRIAFSSLDDDKIETVYSAIYETADELARA